jgi:hypothetical protein
VIAWFEGPPKHVPLAPVLPDATVAQHATVSHTAKGEGIVRPGQQ